MNNTNFVSKILKGRDVSAAPLMNNYNQNERTLLPICEADETLFLSAVYNKKYTSEKITSRCPQSGRSMIEMLGVLAIIGVLSVGGIAGYSKAMQRYRVNKAIEEITLIAGNIRTFFKGNYENIYCEGGYCEEAGCYGYDASSGGEIFNGCPILKKAKIFPDEMLTLDSTGKKITAVTNAFGYWVETYPANIDGKPNKSVELDYYIGTNVEACIELLTHDWNNANFNEVSVFDGIDIHIPPSMPISLDDAVTSCQNLNEYSRINFFFK